MSNKKHFMSIDPSLSNTALVFGYVENGVVYVKDYTVIHTEKSSQKKLPVMEDRLSRIQEIFKTITRALNDCPSDYFFGELPSGSQSSQASVGVGVSLAILATFEDIMVVNPFDVKKIVKKGAVSKDEIMDYVYEKYKDSGFKFETKKDGSLVKTRMEHVCDAIVIAEACVKKYKL